MKRGYFSNGQGGGLSGVKRQAMEQYTRTREKIERENPHLLDSIRRRISSPPDLALSPRHNPPSRAPKTGIGKEIRGDTSIDRRKNLQTVLRFIELSKAEQSSTTEQGANMFTHERSDDFHAKIMHLLSTVK